MSAHSALREVSLAEGDADGADGGGPVAHGPRLTCPLASHTVSPVSQRQEAVHRQVPSVEPTLLRDGRGFPASQLRRTVPSPAAGPAGALQQPTVHPEPQWPIHY